MKCEPSFPNEVFVGNVYKSDSLDELKGIRYRRGPKAYDIFGRIVEHMDALYINKEDFKKYDDIRMKELKEIRASR